MTHGKARVGMYWHGKDYNNLHYILLAGGQNGHVKLGNLLEIIKANMVKKWNKFAMIH